MRRFILFLALAMAGLSIYAKRQPKSPWEMLHVALKQYIDHPCKHKANAFIKQVLNNRHAEYKESDYSSYESYVEYVGFILAKLEKALKSKDPVAAKVGLYLCDASPDVHLFGDTLAMEATAIASMPEIFLIEASQFKGAADVPLRVVTAWNVEEEDPSQACKEFKERKSHLQTVTTESLSKLRDSYVRALDDEIKGTCAF